jgi:hypothetical protein
MQNPVWNPTIKRAFLRSLEIKRMFNGKQIDRKKNNDESDISFYKSTKEKKKI